MVRSMFKLFLVVAGGCLIPGLFGGVWAGPPLTTPEGLGGVALNPMAYVANPAKDGKGANKQVVGYPQIGVWKINFYQNKPGPIGRIDWTAMGATISFFNRFEVGYARENVDIDNIQNVGVDNLAFKVALVKEGAFDIKHFPAISVGVIAKETNFNGAKHKRSVDYYVVGTKTISSLPLPLVINAGLRVTKGVVRGVLGFGNDQDTIFFGNIEAVVFKKFIIGWEFQDAVDAGNGYKTHSMWEAHIAYMPNPKLTLVGSLGYVGDHKESGNAFGKAFVLSLQYAF